MKYTEIFRHHYNGNGGEDLEKAIQELKNAGASQMDCVKPLIHELKISIPDADSLVLYSEAWRDEQKNVEEFRTHFYALANKLSKKC